MRRRCGRGERCGHIAGALVMQRQPDVVSALIKDKVKVKIEVKVSLGQG